MSRCGEVLVAVMNNRPDFVTAHDQHWYRIPVDKANKMLKNRWPPQWLAFYQTKVFGQEAFAVNYKAQVQDIHEVPRQELFPGEPPNKKSSRRYYQLWLDSLQPLPHPIFSRRWRRIVFIPTTLDKFANAIEINDLYEGSPLEDRLWAELRHHRIQAERQWLVRIKKRNYLLDFAIHCAKGKVDIETDGDKYHLGSSEKAAEDNDRNNDLASVGWEILRFTSHQILNEMKELCLPKIASTINCLGGVDEEGLLPRKINLDPPDGMYQLGLFETL